jgi:hypothetical protein
MAALGEQQLDVDGDLAEFALEDLAENFFSPDDLLVPLGDAAVDHAALDLYVTRHSVHNTVTTPHKEYIVSNMRDFQLDVELHDRRTGQLSHEPLPLRATLLYENGQPVRQSSPNEMVLIGRDGSGGDMAPQVSLSGGKATFFLRMGPQTLTHKHDGQRFRIRIEPTDNALSGTSYPGLTQLTEPLKSVTKLHRTPASAAAASLAAKAAAGAAATSLAASSGSSARGSGVGPRDVARHSYGSTLQQLGVGGSVGGPSSCLPLPAGCGATSGGGPSIGASSTASAAASPLSAAAERQAIEKYVQHQKAQIEQLVTLNKQLKQEVERLKEAEAQRKRQEETKD